MRRGHIIIGLVAALVAAIAYRPTSAALHGPTEHGNPTPAAAATVGGLMIGAQPVGQAEAPPAPAVESSGPGHRETPWMDRIDAGRAELRRRIDAAVALWEAQRRGDGQAAQALARQRASEADPRVRHALTHGETPDVPRPRLSGPSLPPPADRTPAGPIAVYWLSPDGDGVYHSRITVDDEGRAQVETTFEQTDGPTWTVRHPAWTWLAADGRTVIDARDQEVDLVRCPAGATWSPDSMLITPDGRVTLIDDVLAPGSGTTGSLRDG